VAQVNPLHPKTVVDCQTFSCRQAFQLFHAVTTKLAFFCLETTIFKDSQQSFDATLSLAAAVLPEPGADKNACTRATEISIENTLIIVVVICHRVYRKFHCTILIRGLYCCCAKHARFGVAQIVGKSKRTEIALRLCTRPEYDTTLTIDNSQTSNDQ
jgi:hypothetical protein